MKYKSIILLENYAIDDTSISMKVYILVLYDSFKKKNTS
jgi:hypothetical protein